MAKMRCQGRRIFNYKAHHLFQGEATFERDVQLGNQKGKQYKLKFGNVVGMLQVFSTKRHGYAVATIQAREDAEVRNYFFSSLQLTDGSLFPQKRMGSS